jgi:hypothetical protein
MPANPTIEADGARPHRIGRYWWYVLRLALKEMRGELAKSAMRIAGGGVAAVLVYAWLPSVGVDKVVATTLFVLVGAGVAIAWKLVTIPARLHEWQVARRDHRAAADELRKLLRGGYALLNASSRGSGAWQNQTLDWEAGVSAVLATYNQAELTLFETITDDAPRRASEQDLASAGFTDLRSGGFIFRGWHPDARLRAKLSKLRLITARAYERAGAGTEAATIETHEGG